MKSYILAYLRKETLTALNFQQAEGWWGGGHGRERWVYLSASAVPDRGGPLSVEVVVGLSVESSWKELQCYYRSDCLTCVVVMG